MIEVFKITHDIYDTAVSPDLSFGERANTRGDNYKLRNQSFNNDLRKHFFSTRIVHIWNSLPKFSFLFFYLICYWFYHSSE